MIVKRFKNKIKAVSEMLWNATPVFPLIRDSIRLQFSDYYVMHCESKLSFNLRSRCGDWFTFYECCIRKDYFPKEIKIEAGDRVLDIGGNFGAFTLMAAKKVGIQGIVHSYEPSPDSFSRIRAHVDLNGIENTQIMNCAVGGENGTTTLYVHKKSALSSTIKIIDGRKMDQSRPIAVEVISISAVLNKLKGEIALIKIDCEGAEYEIFERIERDDLSRVRAVMVETHNVPGKSRDAIEAKLRENNFLVMSGNPFVAINMSFGYVFHPR